MTDYYLRSTTGNDGNNGLTWATAWATMTHAMVASGNADRIFVSQHHTESNAGNFQYVPLGQTIVGVDDTSGEPPTTEMRGGQLVVSSDNMTFHGDMRLYSMTLQSAGGCYILGAQPHDHTNCSFKIGSSGAFPVGTGTYNNSTALFQVVQWNNCDVQFNSDKNRIFATGSRFWWSGGSLTQPSGSTPSAVIQTDDSNQRPGMAMLQDIDMSTMGTGINIFDQITTTTFFGYARNLKLPSGWTGHVTGSTPSPSRGSRFEMRDCMAGTERLILRIVDGYGNVRDDQSVLRIGGATADLITPLSWKMTTATTATIKGPLRSSDFAIWNDQVGSPLTLSVEMLSDNQGLLTNNQVWLEVDHLSTADSHYMTFQNTRAEILETAVAHPTSTETWSGTGGFIDPHKQRLEATITPLEPGLIYVRVVSGLNDKVIWVDPLITLTP